MAGRGRGFSFRKTEDSKQDEDGNKLDVTASSSVSSFATPLGRGRGQLFQLNQRPPSQFYSDEQSDISSAISYPSTGRGFGRGTFSLRPPTATPSETPSSGSDSAKSKEYASGEQSTSKQSPKRSDSSGRGRSTSGIVSDDQQSIGRSLSQKLRSMNIGSGSDSAPSASALQIISKPTPIAEPKAVPVKEPQRLQATILTDNEPVLKHGTAGFKYGAVTNSIFLQCDPNFGVFEYEVRFEPEVDDIQMRRRYLGKISETLGNVRIFDGVTLYMPSKLSDDRTIGSVEGAGGQGMIQITIIFKRQKRLGECIQLYNNLFGRIMKELHFERIGRKCFDPTAPKMIPAHKLEVWPGYIQSVDEQEGGLMLTLDVSHRVLCTQTVLDYMRDCLQKSRDNWKEMVKKGLIGSIVITRYNNKTYRIDDIVFDKNPESTFLRGETEVTYLDYFKQNYEITINDKRQPLLISRKSVRISGETEKREIICCLIPELSNMTGLTDEMRSNFHVMKDLATYTKLTPYQRVGSYKKFLQNVNNSPKAKQVLSDWGLKLDTDVSNVTARVLDEESIIFGNNKTFKVGPNADFSRHATSNEVLEPVDLTHWVLMYVKTDKKTADTFESVLMQISGPTGIHVAPSHRIELMNDRTDQYINAIDVNMKKNSKIQLFVTIFPSLRDDRYSAVKKKLCSELPCPSQCINSRTLRNDTKNRSIIQKILLQINAKMGGTLWGIKIPLKQTMICGVDTYHEVGHNGINVGGFVASLNPSYTKWFSKPCIQGKKEELINGLTVAMACALNTYKQLNNALPERIIFYRDGVGDGQLDYVKGFEIPQFQKAFNEFQAGYSPQLTFLVVQKRINTKFFKVVNDKTEFVNPPPGSVLDNVVTRRYMYDFYLCSQHVREGTTTPSHYIVLRDDSEFQPDILQRLTYKLSYLYYNWPGAVRVPAPCQYAHKLAYLVGMSIKRQVADSLTDKLFYL